MLRSISIQLMWTGQPYADRVRSAAAAGFDLVDLWDSRTSDIDAVASAARESGIGINGFFGNRDTTMCDPAQRAAVIDEIARSMETAQRVGARQLHMFSNAIRPGGIVVPAPDLPAAALRETCADVLGEVATRFAGNGVTLILEHLNDVFLPGYLWCDVADVVALADLVDRPEVKVVFDTFHQQLSVGNLTAALRAALPRLGRIDLAEVPDRAEPGRGEIDMGWLREEIERSGWDGTLTFEVVPSDGDPQTAVDAVERYFPASWCRSITTNSRGAQA